MLFVLLSPDCRFSPLSLTHVFVRATALPIEFTIVHMPFACIQPRTCKQEIATVNYSGLRQRLLSVGGV